MAIIESFTGDYDFLSNFYLAPVRVTIGHGEQWYDTVEHAFQAAKSTDPVDQAWIRSQGTPAAAKRCGRQVTLRPDWEQAKDEVMYRLVSAKFRQHADLGQRLMGTSGRTLVEGNTWGDRYWGMVRGQGENKLGLILMRVRQELLADGTDAG